MMRIRSAMGPLWISHVDGKHRLSFESVRCHVDGMSHELFCTCLLSDTMQDPFGHGASLDEPCGWQA